MPNNSVVLLKSAAFDDFLRALATGVFPSMSQAHKAISAGTYDENLEKKKKGSFT
jgi:hypothetical protein